MSTENNCKVSIIKTFLVFLGKHNAISLLLFGAMALGFIIVAGSVGYATILQAKIGCLSFFGLFK
jgi:hypothetical protein